MKNLILILLIALIVSGIILFPLVQIWALNTLFHVLSIPYNFWSWLAMVVVNISFFGSSTGKLIKTN